MSTKRMTILLLCFTLVMLFSACTVKEEYDILIVNDCSAEVYGFSVSSEHQTEVGCNADYSPLKKGEQLGFSCGGAEELRISALSKADRSLCTQTFSNLEREKQYCFLLRENGDGQLYFVNVSEKAPRG